MDAYIAALEKYAVFEGRASRREYWMFMLVNLLVALAITAIEAMTGSPGIVAVLYSLGVMVPSVAVAARRLHDTGRSGWWLLASLIPAVGMPVLLVLLLINSDAGNNRYGPVPPATQPRD